MAELPAAAPEGLRAFVDSRLADGALFEFDQASGGFSIWTLRISGLVLWLRQEYSSWLLTLEGEGIPQLPVSFWRQALAGSKELPGTSSIEDDVAFLSDNWNVLAKSGRKFAPRLNALAMQYREAMRAKYF